MERILRPLSYGDLFDEMFDLYKKNFLLFMGIVSLTYIPVFVIQYYFLISYVGRFMQQMAAPNPATQSPTALLGQFASLMKVAAPAGIVGWLLQVLMTGAVTIAVSSCYLGERPTILGSYKAILPRLFPLIITSLMTLVVCAVATALCCLPLIPVALLLAFISEVVVLERCGYIQAMKRSVNLVAFDWGKVFVVLLLVIVVVWILGFIVSVPFQVLLTISKAAPGSAQWMKVYTLQNLVSVLASMFTMPLYTISFVLLYYDIRIRKEGFDLQLLAQNMQRTGASADVGNSE